MSASEEILKLKRELDKLKKKLDEVLRVVYIDDNRDSMILSWEEFGQVKSVRVKVEEYTESKRGSFEDEEEVED